MKKCVIFQRICFTWGICYWLWYENDHILDRNGTAAHLCSCCQYKPGWKSWSIYVGRWVAGGQHGPLQSELCEVQTKATFVAALLQKDHRYQWLYSHGTGFWVKGQLFSGLLATASCSCHIQRLVTGPVQLAPGTAPWVSIWGSRECWRHTKPRQGLFPVHHVLLGEREHGKALLGVRKARDLSGFGFSLLFVRPVKGEC